MVTALNGDPRMSIDTDLLDRLIEGRSPGDIFGWPAILSELSEALAEPPLSRDLYVHLGDKCIGERLSG